MTIYVHKASAGGNRIAVSEIQDRRSKQKPNFAKPIGAHEFDSRHIRSTRPDCVLAKCPIIATHFGLGGSDND